MCGSRSMGCRPSLSDDHPFRASARNRSIETRTSDSLQSLSFFNFGDPDESRIDLVEIRVNPFNLHHPCSIRQQDTHRLFTFLCFCQFGDWQTILAGRSSVALVNRQTRRSAPTDIKTVAHAVNMARIIFFLPALRIVIPASETL